MDGVKPRLPSPRSFNGTGLNSSPLLRLLAGLGVAEVAATSLSLAERWSPWLAWTDAITLSAVLGAGASGRPASAKPGGAGLGLAVIDECRRLRQDLAQAIDTDAVFTAGTARKSAPALDGPLPDPADLASLQRQYRAHQRVMDERIAALRAQVRAALAGLGGELGRLAALDAVLDQALAARQRRLLASVPGWLEWHVKRLPAAAPSAAAQMQHLLRAELDLRLQPVEGMLDAMAAAARSPAGNHARPRARERA